MTEAKRTPRRGRAYWYRIEIRECPACGRNTEYRERHYGKKPQQNHFYAQLWCGACFEIERLRDERDALREALLKYGQHLPNSRREPACAWYYGRPCTCGLDAAIAAGERK